MFLSCNPWVVLISFWLFINKITDIRGNNCEHCCLYRTSSIITSRCNPILPKGEYPQGCRSGWRSRPFPQSTCFHSYLQSLPLIILLIPKPAQITSLNDCRCSDSVFSKCFEKVIRDSVLPASLDPLQFSYCGIRCTDDVTAFTLNTAPPPGQ